MFKFVVFDLKFNILLTPILGTCNCNWLCDRFEFSVENENAISKEVIGK